MDFSNNYFWWVLVFVIKMLKNGNKKIESVKDHNKIKQIKSHDDRIFINFICHLKVKQSIKITVLRFLLVFVNKEGKKNQSWIFQQ